ncbi:MAG: CorA family divalent cation transporter, partial [Oscillospiraceae bacterium]
MQTLTLMEDIDSLKTTFGEDLIEYVKGGQLNRFELFGENNIMYFKVYNITQPLSKPFKFIILQSREDLSILCHGKRAKELMTDCYSPRITDNEKQLYNIFSLLLKNDGDNLESLEEHIIKTEDNLVERVKMDYQREIVGIRKSLMVLKKYYYQLLRVFEGISENENQLFSSSGLALLHIIE